MAFPRLGAFAEVVWSRRPQGFTDFADFEVRLTAHLRRLDALGVEHRRHGGPLPWQSYPAQQEN